MKEENERRAKILGFDCYYDLDTGGMRSAGSELMDWIFTIVLLLNYAYRIFMWKAFFKLVSLNTEVKPDDGEDVKDMYLKLEELIENRKILEGRE